MQGYTYSTFSAVAIAIHLIINFDLIRGRVEASMRGSRYRSFLIGVLVYYVADAAWGVFAGLGWTRALYVDTIFFFLSLAVFATAWCRFAVAYLNFGKWTARILVGMGYALLAANVAALAANFSNGCVFYFDDKGTYLCGWMRDPLFDALIAYNALLSVFAFAKAVKARDAARSRDMMVFVNCVALTIAIMLQVVWPLTPFTALGCLIGNCFLHIFVVQDERAAKRTAELESALERAREAEKARSMFFSIVSHDIRTPLNAILGYSELLQHGMDSEAERNEALKSIRASGTTLMQLVNDVLDFAKMDAGKMTLHPAPMRLGRLTEDVFASFRLAASKKGIELVNRAVGVPTVVLDDHRVRQILFNLIGNAVKFTERGAVTVAASYDGSNLEFSVADTGCGIAPDMLSNILEPFFQVHDPSRSAYHEVGTGLGLPICRRLVEMMGGKLHVESEQGKGSVFRITLPGVKAAGGEVGENSSSWRKEGKIPLSNSHSILQLNSKLQLHSPTPTQFSNSLPPTPTRLSNSYRILVVDDSPVNRSVLKAFLKKAGVASIDMACDGVEALAKLDSAAKAGNPYDFVFSDFWMPNMNGLELIGKLREDHRFVRLPVFAVTADTEVGHDSRSALFTGILLKPVTYDKLLEAFASDMRA